LQVRFVDSLEAGKKTVVSPHWREANMSDYNIPMQGILRFFLNVKDFFDLEVLKGDVRLKSKVLNLTRLCERFSAKQSSD